MQWRESLTGLPGGHSEWEPPDPLSNSEVKTLCADGSLPFGHARVGHCQALNTNPTLHLQRGIFLFRLSSHCRPITKASLTGRFDLAVDLILSLVASTEQITIQLRNKFLQRGRESPVADMGRTGHNAGTFLCRTL